jgi:hypothetical protein
LPSPEPPGKLHPSLRDILPRDQHLLEFLKDHIILLGRDNIELGDVLCDPLDLDVTQILHDLGSRFLTERNHQNGYFYASRHFFSIIFFSHTQPLSIFEFGLSPI